MAFEGILDMRRVTLCAAPGRSSILGRFARHSHCASSLTLSDDLFAVGNFTLKEWGMPAILGALGYPVGFFASGNPSPAFARLGGNVARPTALMAASLGAAAGFLLSYQSSWARYVDSVVCASGTLCLQSLVPSLSSSVVCSLARLTGYSNDA